MVTCNYPILEHVAKWIGYLTQDQKAGGVDSHCWSCVEVSAKLLNYVLPQATQP